MRRAQRIGQRCDAQVVDCGDGNGRQKRAVYHRIQKFYGKFFVLNEIFEQGIFFARKNVVFDENTDKIDNVRQVGRDFFNGGVRKGVQHIVDEDVGVFIHILGQGDAENGLVVLQLPCYARDDLADRGGNEMGFVEGVGERAEMLNSLFVKLRKVGIQYFYYFYERHHRGNQIFNLLEITDVRFFVGHVREGLKGLYAQETHAGVFQHAVAGVFGSGEIEGLFKLLNGHNEFGFRAVVTRGQLFGCVDKATD